MLPDSAAELTRTTSSTAQFLCSAKTGGFLHSVQVTTQASTQQFIISLDLALLLSTVPTKLIYTEENPGKMEKQLLKASKLVEILKY